MGDVSLVPAVNTATKHPHPWFLRQAWGGHWVMGTDRGLQWEFGVQTFTEHFLRVCWLSRRKKTWGEQKRKRVLALGESPLTEKDTNTKWACVSLQMQQDSRDRGVAAGTREQMSLTLKGKMWGHFLAWGQGDKGRRWMDWGWHRQRQQQGWSWMLSPGGVD